MGDERVVGSITSIVLSACGAPREVCCVDDVATVAGMSRRTLQRRCQAHGVPAKRLVDFVICGRALISRETQDDTPLFPNLDPRTAMRLCKNGRLMQQRLPSLAEFAENQVFIRDPNIRRQLAAAFARGAIVGAIPLDFRQDQPRRFR